VNKYKVAKHLILDIGEDHLDWRLEQAAMDAEAALDGIYVIRTLLQAEKLDAAATVAAYKNLSRVERDFRSMKADDLDLRPIHHRLGDRVRGHVLICMLAAYLAWHLRKALAPSPTPTSSPRGKTIRSPPPAAPRTRPPRPPPTPVRTDTPCAASAASWPTSPS
jgi:hypothetical protein